MTTNITTTTTTITYISSRLKPSWGRIVKAKAIHTQSIYPVASVSNIECCNKIGCSHKFESVYSYHLIRLLAPNLFLIEGIEHIEHPHSDHFRQCSLPQESTELWSMLRVIMSSMGKDRIRLGWGRTVPEIVTWFDCKTEHSQKSFFTVLFLRLIHFGTSTIEWINDFQILHKTTYSFPFKLD